jgi:subfamily B ATP-binding cassette protein MsbA
MTESPLSPTAAGQAGVRQRLLRLHPYFGQQRGMWIIAVLATVTGALTEPLIPALFQPLLDKGFTQNALPLWSIPLAVIGLFMLRGEFHRPVCPCENHQRGHGKAPPGPVCPSDES